MSRILGSSRSAIVASRCVRRSGDDCRRRRSPRPPRRHLRDEVESYRRCAELERNEAAAARRSTRQSRPTSDRRAATIKPSIAPCATDTPRRSCQCCDAGFASRALQNVPRRLMNMSDTDHGRTSKPRVFISYSRVDIAFAENLLAALGACGFDTYLDTHDIAPGEPWEQRLGRLIFEADTVVFIISPESVASEHCIWEITETERLAKRLLPIVWRPVAEEKVPDRLQRLNFVFFDDSITFGTALAKLVSALNADLGWLREHTRLNELALRWESRRRDETALLRGSDIEEAKGWVSRQPRNAPEPTNLQLAFIAASEEAEAIRASKERQQLERVRRFQRRFAMVLFAAAILLAIGSVGAFAFYRINSLRESILYASLSRYALSQGFNDRGLRYALAGLPGTSRSFINPWSEEAIAALTAASYLNRLRLVLAAHGQGLRDVKFSPDGMQLATASSDKTARIWDAQTGTLLHTLQGHSQAVQHVVYSPDGKGLLTSEVGTVRLWGAQSGNLLQTFTPGVGTEMTPVFTSDGKTLITQLDWSSAAAWDTHSGQRAVEFRGHSDYLNDATLVESEGLLITASQDKTAKLWNLATGKVILNLEGHEDGVRRAVMMPDSQSILTASNSTVRRWDAHTGTLLKVYNTPHFRFTDLVVSKTGKFFVTASYEGAAQIWETEEDKPKFTLEHAQAIIQVQLSADEKRVITTGWDNRVRVWNVANGELLLDLAGHEGRIMTAHMNSAKDRIVTASEDTTARIWDIREDPEPVSTPVESNFWDMFQSAIDGKSLTLETGKQSLELLSLDPTGVTRQGTVVYGQGQIVGLCARGQRKLVILATPKPDIAIREVPETDFSVEFELDSAISAQCSPNQAYVGVTTKTKYSLFDLTDRRRLFEIEIPQGQYKDFGMAKFSPDSKYVAIQREAFDQTVSIYDLNMAKKIGELRGHEARIADLVYHPQSKAIVSTSNDGSVRVWEVETGKQIGTMFGHTNTVTKAVFSADGDRLLTASLDQTARLWDFQTRQLLAVLTGHRDGVWDAEFGPDGSWAVTASQDKTIRVWDTKTASQLAVLTRPRAPMKLLVSSDGRNLVTLNIDTAVKVPPLVLEVHDIGRLVNVTPSQLTVRACTVSLQNESARAFSKFDMQNPIFHNQPQMKNPCEGKTNLTEISDVVPNVH
jgi:WD40 repeat protein